MRTPEAIAPGLLQEGTVVDRHKRGDRLGGASGRRLVVRGQPIDDLLRPHWVIWCSHGSGADDFHAVLLERGDELLLELRDAAPVG